MINFFILNDKNNNIDKIEKRTPNLRLNWKKKKKREIELNEKIFDEIEIKKDLLFDKYNDYVSKGWKQLFDVYDKFDNDKQENNMDIFYSIKKKIDK